ncbi:MAG: macro domain-containing protein [Planctomycetes bacterium]|nr:macro domain-containing protein [Planctomycetota bacterium]
MIRYTQGNLLEANAEAVVNTVNEVGVMGKGIALLIRESFPDSARAYMDASKRGEVRVGKMLVTPASDLLGPRWIIHFPTKKHWRHPSKMEWVREGLRDLVRVVHEKGLRSIALPPLGCGSGGLEWNQVRREIEIALGDLKDVDVVVYEPTGRYQNAPKREGVEELTPARALIAELVRRYGVLGLECSHLEVQKLAWFAQRVIATVGLPDPLKLSFSANRYGPYSDQLRHLLNALDGSYLHCEKRLADAGPLEPLWFESNKRKVVAQYLQSDEAKPYQEALDRTSVLIDGFESPLGMELLATVDWLLSKRGCQPNVEALAKGIEEWPGGRTAAQRKQKIFDQRLLDLALQRLTAHGDLYAG